jgi:hypothetical protein
MVSRNVGLNEDSNDDDEGDEDDDNGDVAGRPGLVEVADDVVVSPLYEVRMANGKPSDSHSFSMSVANPSSVR